jgi:hypothetical protein
MGFSLGYFGPQVNQKIGKMADPGFYCIFAKKKRPGASGKLQISPTTIQSMLYILYLDPNIYLLLCTMLYCISQLVLLTQESLEITFQIL